MTFYAIIPNDPIINSQNRLCIEDNSNAAATHENTKVASLEAEVLQLVNLIEGACQKCPEIYQALRDHYYMNEGA